MNKHVTLSIVVISILLSVSSSVSGSDGVSLRWKVGDGLEYLTSMDTLQSKSSLADQIAASGNTGMNEPGRPPRDFINELSKPRDYSMNSRLIPLKSGNIAVEIRMGDVREKQAPTSETGRALAQLYRSMSGTLQLRGEIDPTGRIKSFWLPQAQKNIVALFFQLPAKRVKVGDEWDLDVNYIQMGANFICERSNASRKAKLISLTEEAGDTVAKIEYEINENVEGHFDVADVKGKTVITFRGTGEFLINAGRWRSFLGTMTSSANQGFMNMSQESVQEFRLVPID